MGSQIEFYQANPLVAMEVMQQLVRTVAEQQEAEQAAYERGWAECGQEMAKYAAEMWEAGYAASEADMDLAWKPVARQVRALGSPNSKTWEQLCAARGETPLPRGWRNCKGLGIAHAHRCETQVQGQDQMKVAA